MPEIYFAAENVKTKKESKQDAEKKEKNKLAARESRKRKREAEEQIEKEWQCKEKTNEFLLDVKEKLEHLKKLCVEMIEISHHETNLSQEIQPDDEIQNTYLISGNQETTDVYQEYLPVIIPMELLLNSDSLPLEEPTQAMAAATQESISSFEKFSNKSEDLGCLVNNIENNMENSNRAVEADYEHYSVFQELTESMSIYSNALTSTSLESNTHQISGHYEPQGEGGACPVYENHEEQGESRSYPPVSTSISKTDNNLHFFSRGLSIFDSMNEDFNYGDISNFNL